MHFLSEQLQEYVNAHTQDEPELLRNLRKETLQRVLQPRMLSGHFQGRVLSLFSKLQKPKNILEIGTYTGYATLCLAEGLAPDGTLHTIDNNSELQSIQQKYFKASAFGNQIRSHLGNALEIIPKLPDFLDLVFIDADKQNYANYFQLVMRKMSKGGLIISDNVLWSGKVLADKAQKKDATTQALIDYNMLLKNDPRVETILLPIRDGLTVCRIL